MHEQADGAPVLYLGRSPAKSTRQRIARIFQNRLLRAADSARRATANSVRAQIERYITGILSAFHDNREIRMGPIIARYAQVELRQVDGEEREVELALGASRLLSLASNIRQMKSAGAGERIEPKAAPVAAFAEGDDFLAAFGDYERAARWMIERDVMSRAELESLARAIANNSGLLQVQVEQQLRQGALALARSTSENMTVAFRNSISRAVDEGASLGQWADALRAELGSDLPGGIDSYLEVVYRNEMGAAYREQREEFQNDPDVQEVVWGKELFANTDPDREHHRGHVEINNLLLRKGSPAWEASFPGPPYHHNCLCDEALIVVGGPDEMDDYQEPDNALELVRNIQRFGEAA